MSNIDNIISLIIIIFVSKFMYEYFFMRISKSETFRPIASPSNSTTIIHSTGKYLDPKTQKKDIRIRKKYLFNLYKK